MFALLNPGQPPRTRLWLSLEQRGEAAPGAALTSQPGLRHVVGLVVDPLGAVGPDVGLGGGVSHGVVADPSGQVDVESAGVDDAVRIHQAPFGQLQKGNRGLSGWGFGGEKRAPHQPGNKA